MYVLKYQLHVSVAKERRTKRTVESFREKLLFVQSDVSKYRQRLPLYTKQFTADVTDDFSRFLEHLRTEVRKLAEHQRKDRETTVETDFEAIDAFPQSFDCKIYWKCDTGKLC